MTTKKCCKCKIELSVDNFGLLKTSKDGYRYDCKLCRMQYRNENKELIQEKQQKYYENNKVQLLLQNKQYRENNITKINTQRKEYRNRPEVKEHIKEQNKANLPKRKELIKEKRRTDINFQISEILRSKIHKMIRNHKTSYQDIIGCDVTFLKRWIEYRFDANMNWSNLGDYWQIDHIMPINAFNFVNTNEINICFHWTNLQPLTCYENKSKSDKLVLYYYFNNIVSVNRFNSKYKQFLGYEVLNESLRWLRIKLRDRENATDNTMDNQQPSL